MRYRVAHTTEYCYGESVPLCHNVIRLRPRDTDRQTCRRSALTITPAPAQIREGVDFYGNHTTWVSLQEPHDVLRIEVVSEVEVVKPPAPPVAPGDPARGAAAPAGPTWESARDRLAEGREPALLAVREFTFASPHVPPGPELAEYARPSFTPGRLLSDCLLDLTRRIFREFTFDSRATTVGTPVLEVLHHRRGVCQDFAHLQIGCLRSLGLAARYVSGYVLTYPPPGQKRLVGADASHAWVAACVPDLGWVDLDPTNGVTPSDEHVTIGWGRDYDDLSPVKGVLVGGHRHSMYFGVDVQPLDVPECPETPAGEPAAGGEAAVQPPGKEAPPE